ncbi:uncharacterized protein YndB with AHSA1/START domain [Aureibacillus halotolerans]|uniref:Uncharacterized protein YndB with AHSA1/START domain n=2 Tax=Aureibacillus halotolerans TaxID=1508390 RepID=A0A4R6U420_9BACI|nr:uncharacterized protein YndB with AHSA1/START domain [Aureibacillus halotolerans]
MESITTLTMVRQFNTSVEEVFDAWLAPGTMRKWLFTSEATNKLVENVAHVGGHWEIIDHREEKDYRAIGEYKDIDRPHRLEFTFKMPQFSDSEDTIVVELNPIEDGCEMTFTQHIHVPHEDNWAEADILKAIDEFRDGSEHGWNLMFISLGEQVE